VDEQRREILHAEQRSVRLPERNPWIIRALTPKTGNSQPTGDCAALRSSRQQGESAPSLGAAFNATRR